MNNNRVWTIVAIVLMVLPFAALGFELAKAESIGTLAVFGAMGLLLFGTLIAGLRVKPTNPGDERDSTADSATPAKTSR